MADVKTDWPAELERLAREAETEALVRADELFAEAVAEHVRQTSGYNFECRRWGDFLTVFVERQGNESSGWHDYGRKVSTSLNIGQVKEVRLVPGHCFDRLGRLSYHASMVSDKGDGGSGWGTGAGRSAPWKGHHYEVQPNYPWIPSARPMIEFAKKEDRERGMYMDNNDYQPRYVTEGYPRPAKDDVISFRGIDATIHAPAGKGQAVYDAIMAELERGYERPVAA